MQKYHYSKIDIFNYRKDSVCNDLNWWCLCFINSNPFQASSLTVLSDIERREKKEVMGKLHEMEKELKVHKQEYL